MARSGNVWFAALGVLSSDSSADLCSRCGYGHLYTLLLASTDRFTGSHDNMLRS